MTTTNQKVDLNNCTDEQLFIATSKIQAKAAATFVKDERRIGHHMKHMPDMAEHYVVTAIDNFGKTREAHPRFTNFLPGEFGATKDYWEENGNAPAVLTLQEVHSAIDLHIFGTFVGDFVPSDSHLDAC